MLSAKRSQLQCCLMRLSDISLLYSGKLISTRRHLLGVNQEELIEACHQIYLYNNQPFDLVGIY